MAPPATRRTVPTFPPLPLLLPYQSRLHIRERLPVLLPLSLLLLLLLLLLGDMLVSSWCSPGPAFATAAASGDPTGALLVLRMMLLLPLPLQLLVVVLPSLQRPGAGPAFTLPQTRSAHTDASAAHGAHTAGGNLASRSLLPPQI